MLNAVKTPLSLAALVLLLISQILRHANEKRGRPNPGLVKWLMGLGLACLTIIVLSDLLKHWWLQEIRFSGSVVDEAGMALDGAAIRIPGADGGRSDVTGAFAFTVPASRSAPSYTADVSLRGYVSQQVEFKPRRPEPVRIVLSRRPYLEGSMLNLSGQVVVRHFLGTPQLDATVQFANPSGDSIIVREISVAVSTSGGESRLLLPEVTYMGGMVQPAWSMLALAPGQVVTVGYGFSSVNSNLMAYQGKLAQALGQKVVVAQLPDPRVTLLSPELVREARQMLAADFWWTVGTTHLTVSATFGQRRVTREFTFALSAGDVAAMKAIGEFYGSGIGVLPAWRNIPVEQARPAVVLLPVSVSPTP
ncbi:MAG: carboxypeptidase regulatory-like domain-containing protein [Gemmatimonadetes bacterium]|nr:carboxypeptidase regulatory-like domain-containing protein [Gemmatimonadota bacterium]